MAVHKMGFAFKYFLEIENFKIKGRLKIIETILVNFMQLKKKQEAKKTFGMEIS